MGACVYGEIEIKRFRGFIVEQSGDTMNIAATPEAWKPKKW
jgi:hypothetical protein